MFDTVAILLSFVPLAGLAAANLLFRRTGRLKRAIFGLLMILISLPVGIELIGKVLHFPENIGDHNPGFGVVFVPLIVIWFLCLLEWFVQSVVFALLKLRSNNTRA
jgi:hypothetical protein